MIKLNKKSTLTLFTLLATCSYNTCCLAEGNKQVLTITPEKASDLAFSDCEELEKLLKSQKDLVSSIEKLKLAENLSKIIVLKTLNTPQFTSSASAPFNPKAFDVALTLNPNSENKAKECAINSLPLLLPESVVSIPELLSSSRDNSLPRHLRVQMLTQARVLGEAVKEPLKDYALSALINQFKNNKLILSDLITVPAILPLVDLHKDIYRDLSIRTKAYAISYTLRILDPEGKVEVPALLNHLESTNSEISKTYILKTLSDFPKQLNEILLALPKIVPTLSTNELDSLLDTINSISYTNLAATPEQISDNIGETLLGLSPSANEKQLSGLTNIMRETNLNANSILCVPQMLQKELSNLKLPQKIVLASMCSRKNVDIKILKSLFKSNQLENLIVGLALTTKNEPLRRVALEEAYSKLETLKSTLSPKEYRETGYFLIAIENMNSSSSSRKSYIKLAETLISEEPIYPSTAKYLIKNAEHPSITLLSSLGKKSLPTIIKLLKNPISPTLRQRGLTVVGSDSYVAYPELIETVEALIADEDLDTRRQAYQILSKRSLNYPTSNHLKSSKNTSNQFYKARLSMQFLDKKDIRNRKVSATLLFSALVKLRCQESTVPLANITPEDIAGINPIIKESAEAYLIECLGEKGQMGRRAIGTLELLSPLSDSGKKKFEARLASEKLPQLSGEDGIRYLNLIYVNSNSITQIPKQVLANLLSGTSIKDQVLYSIWLMSRFSGVNEIKNIIDEYFDATVKSLVNLALTRRENKEELKDSELEDNLDKVFDLLNKNGKDLTPLLNQFSNETKVGLIKKAESNLDASELLSLKHVICPNMSFNDCNIAIMPPLESILENPENTLEEISLLLDRRMHEPENDKLLIRTAIDNRLEALIQMGKFSVLTNNKNTLKISDSLESCSLHSKDDSTKLIAKFLHNTLASK